MGDLGVDVIRYYIIHDRAGARAFNKQAIIPQSLDHNVEILKPRFAAARLSHWRAVDTVAKV